MLVNESLSSYLKLVAVSIWNDGISEIEDNDYSYKDTLFAMNHLVRRTMLLLVGTESFVLYPSDTYGCLQEQLVQYLPEVYKIGINKYLISGDKIDIISSGLYDFMHDILADDIKQPINVNVHDFFLKK